MPESSDSSNTPSSSLFVHVELGTQTALVQLIAPIESTVHGFSERLPYYRRLQTLAVQLHISLCWGVKLIEITTTHQTVAVMVPYDSILCDICMW